MKIYTKKGDKGTTSLVGGERVDKDDLRVDAYGTVDELTAVIAYLRDSMGPRESVFEDFRDDLRRILNTLMGVEASLASTKAVWCESFRVPESEVEYLEGRIDLLHDTLKPIERFTLPGGHPLVSLSHVCRTVCRRAERCAVRSSKQFEVDPNALTYLNRLSDYLYELGRKLAQELGAAEEYWEPTKCE